MHSILYLIKIVIESFFKSYPTKIKILKFNTAHSRGGLVTFFLDEKVTKKSIQNEASTTTGHTPPVSNTGQAPFCPPHALENTASFRINFSLSRFKDY